MKTVLCYGDSLPWGYDAETQGRHHPEDRWPSVVQAGSVASAASFVGVHLDVANTGKIGEAMAPVVRTMLQL